LPVTLWVITTSIVPEDGRWIPPVISRNYGTFSTYAECVRTMDDRIVELEKKGEAKRLDKYKTQNKHGVRHQWECAETK
jgi:hypothetical protein